MLTRKSIQYSMNTCLHCTKLWHRNLSDISVTNLAVSERKTQHRKQSRLVFFVLTSRCVFLNGGRYITFYVAFKIRAKGNDVVTNVICPNQHFASTFSQLIFKFQGRTCCCKPSFLFPPRRQSAPESLLAGKSRSSTECSTQVFNSCTTQSGMFVPMASCCYLILSFKNTYIIWIASKPVGP